MNLEEFYKQTASPVHEECRERVVESLKSVDRRLRAQGVSIHSIKSRLKDVKRVEEKLEKDKVNLGKVGSVYDACEDLIGARLVCFYRDDLEKIRDFVCGAVSPFSVRKTKAFLWRGEAIEMEVGDGRVKESGYTSLHFICTLKGSPDIGPKVQECLFELQVRTILEEAWAEMEHPVYATGVASVRDGFRLFSDLLHVADNLAQMLRRQALSATEGLPKPSEVQNFTYGESRFPTELRSVLDKGNAERASGRTREAIAIHRTILEDPGLLSLAQRYGAVNHARLELGLDYMLARNLRDAQSVYLDILKDDPTNFFASYRLAQAYVDGEMYVQALGVAKRALDLFDSLKPGKGEEVPSKAKVVRQYAYCLWAIGQQSAGAGDALEAADHFRQAIDLSRQALAQAERETDEDEIEKCRNNLAYYLIESGEREAIVEAIELARPIQTIPARDTYAWALFKNGDVEEAYEAIREVWKDLCEGGGKPLGAARRGLIREHLHLIHEQLLLTRPGDRPYGSETPPSGTRAGAKRPSQPRELTGQRARTKAVQRKDRKLKRPLDKRRKR